MLNGKESPQGERQPDKSRPVPAVVHGAITEDTTQVCLWERHLAGGKQALLKKDMNEALMSITAAWQKCRANFKADDPRYILTLTYLGRCHFGLCNWYLAEQFLEQAMQESENSTRALPAEVFESLEQLGAVFESQGSEREAREFYLKLMMLCSRHGHNSTSVQQVRTAVGNRLRMLPAPEILWVG